MYGASGLHSDGKLIIKEKTNTFFIRPAIELKSTPALQVQHTVQLAARLMT